MHDKKRHETVLSLSMSKVILAPLGLILAIALKDKKKYFYKYISNKGRAKDNSQPLLNMGGNSDKGGKGWGT